MPSPNANSVDLAIESLGGKVSQFDPQKLPSGASPFNQDVSFLTAGGVGTRPGMQSVYAPFAGAPTVNYLRTFVDALENFRQLSLDGNGNVRQEFPLGTLAIIGSVVAGCFAQSDTYAGREWMAFGDGQFGIDIPRHFDGTNFDRVSQVGPGVAPTATDSGAAGNISTGLHQVSVCFVLRSGYITAPAPPNSWTAGGSKKVSLTNIATGPPNVVARIVIFTPVITSPATSGPFFYFSEQLTAGSATFPSMIIPDNTTTTATFDFLDAVLQNATAATNLFNLIELGECAAVVQYSERMFWAGERNKVHSAGGGGGFNNLTFDGGFGGGAPTPANSGPNTPTAAISDGPDPSGLTGAVWANPANVEVQDGVTADAVLQRTGLVGNTSNYLYASGFGFAIPANATIVGIILTARVKGSTSIDISDDSVILTKDGTATGSNHHNGNIWTNALAVQTYGSSVDLWGQVWAPADVNAASFGVLYSAANFNAAGARTASVDVFKIQVFFTTPAALGLPPNGWMQGATFAGGDSALNKGLPAYWGDAFAITGDGATAVRGLITQTAFQDYLQVPILSTNTGYGVRVRLRSANGLLQGTFHINLQSASGAFTTSGLAVQANQLTGSYVEFIGTLTSGLTSIPADLLLQVYADGTPTNGGTFLIDCIEPFPLNQPINRTIVRCSYAEDPESIDVLTGFMVAGKDNGQAIRNMTRLLDNKLYLNKERSKYVTSDDNANEPSLWVISTVSDTVGTPSVHGAAVGESWEIIAHHDGAYIFSGADPIKISQEIQPDWDTINWAAAQSIYTVVDTANKRVHIGAPTGASTIPNVEFVMDYSQLNSAQEIADHPQAYYSQFAPGKVIAPGRARKWTLWNLFGGLGANCAAIVLRNDAVLNHVFRGNASGTGKIYDQLAAQLSDDGVAINSMYQTYFCPEVDAEQMLQLGAHRKLFKYLTGYVWGSGAMFFTITGPQGQRQKSLTTLMLRNVDHWDFEMNMNWVGERGSLIFGTNAAGSWFVLTKICPVVQKELFTPVRGSA